MVKIATDWKKPCCGGDKKLRLFRKQEKLEVFSHMDKLTPTLHCQCDMLSSQLLEHMHSFLCFSNQGSLILLNEDLNSEVPGGVS